jgi:hypothetical protein
MFIRFRVHEPIETLDPAVEHASDAYDGGSVWVFYKSVSKARTFLLGRLVSMSPQVPHLVRVVGIGHESGVLTIDLR